MFVRACAHRYAPAFASVRANAHASIAPVLARLVHGTNECKSGALIGAKAGRSCCISEYGHSHRRQIHVHSVIDEPPKLVQLIHAPPPLLEIHVVACRTHLCGQHSTRAHRDKRQKTCGLRAHIHAPRTRTVVSDQLRHQPSMTHLMAKCSPPSIGVSCTLSISRSAGDLPPLRVFLRRGFACLPANHHPPTEELASRKRMGAIPRTHIKPPSSSWRVRRAWTKKRLGLGAATHMHSHMHMHVCV